MAGRKMAPSIVPAQAVKRQLELELAGVLARETLLDQRLRVLAAAQSGTATHLPTPNGRDAAGEDEAESSASSSLAGLSECKAPEECLLEARRHAPNFAQLDARLRSLRAQIDDGHGTAERVSRSVRRLDGTQMKVQRALALVEDALNLRSCITGATQAMAAGDLAEAVGFVRQFRAMNATALGDAREVQEMRAAIDRLAVAVLERFDTAVLEMDLAEIARFCPLLPPLGLSPKGTERYVAFARRALSAALQEAGCEEPSLPPPDTPMRAPEQLSGLYNACAAFLQRQMPVAMAGLAATLGDVQLLRTVHSECAHRAANIIETHMRNRDVAARVAEATEIAEASAAAAATAAAYGLDARVAGGGSSCGGIGGGFVGAGGGLGGGGAGGSLGAGGGSGAGGGGASVAALTELDGLLDDVAVLLQHTESYLRFVHHLVYQIEVAHTVPPEDVDSGDSPSADDGSPGPLQGPVLPQRTRLDEAVAEMAVYYAQLELQLLRASLFKALLIDDAHPSSATSTCVEDAFFVAQRCARRAVATGHAGSASATVNHVNNTLAGEMLEALMTRVRAALHLLPAGGAGTLDLAVKQLAQIDFSGGFSNIKDTLQGNWEGMGGMGGVGAGLASDLTTTATAAITTIRRAGAQTQSAAGGAGGAGGGGAGPLAAAGRLGAGGGGSSRLDGSARGQQRSHCLVYANDLEACAAYALRLRDELLAEAADAYQEGHETEQLMTCLQDMTGTATQFSNAAEQALEEVLNRVRPVVRIMVTGHLGDKSQVTFQLSETDYAHNEASDPFAHRLVEFLDALMRPYEPPAGLTERGFVRLLQLLAGFLAQRLEAALRKRRFSQLGALQLDKDIRCIAGHMSRKAGAPVREGFARLTQMAQLLNLDHPAHALDYWAPGSPLQVHMTAEDVKAVLAQRVDFSFAEIDALDIR